MDRRPSTESEGIGRDPGIDRDVEDEGGSATVKRRRRPSCGCLVIVLLLLLAGGGLGGYVMGTIITREETPLPGEQTIADLGLRVVAVPNEFQDMRDPNNTRGPKNANISVAKGKELFGTQCAICHGQGGKGDAELGRTQYPPAADLTADRVQSKSDGQLYWIIAHGINLSGMPAWEQTYGGSNDKEEVWSLVEYVRTLRGK